MMRRTALAAFLAVAAATPVAVPALAQSATPQSADCGRATRPVDRAICATPQLRALDRRISDRYRDLLSGLDAESASALRQDQRWFVNARDRAAASLSGAELITELTGRLSGRADTLDSLTATPSDGVVGRWRNLYGEITVVQWATGVLTFEANTVDPVSARWVCDADGDGEWTGPEEATLNVQTDSDARWSLRTTRKGDALSVDERHLGGSVTAPYCGMNGMISGTYFRVAGSTDASR